MAKKKHPEPVDDAALAASTFEQSLAEVEQIVQQLENGQLNLSESLRAYEQGVRQLRRCHQELAHVERRIELLIGFDSEGRPVTEAVEADSLSLEQKQAARGRRRGASGPPAEDGEGPARPSGHGRSAVDPFGDTDPERVDDSFGLF